MFMLKNTTNMRKSVELNGAERKSVDTWEKHLNLIDHDIRKSDEKKL